MEYSDYLTRLGLFADHGSHALICCHQKCKRAIPVVKGKPTSHLSSHGIPLHARAALTTVLRTIGLRNPDTLALLKDGSPAHPQLKIYDGYICRKCDTRTRDFQLIKKHSPLYGKGSYPAQTSGSSPSDEHIEYVCLQTWTPKNRKYWIVEHNGTTVRPAGGKPAQDHLQSVGEREIARSQSRADPDMRMLSFAEQSPWLERAGWEAMLKGRDRELLSVMIEIPRPQGGQPHVLVRRDPDCREDGVVSTSEDERRITAILNLVDPMMDRVKPLSSSPEPFQLVRQPSSTRKYRYLQKKLLAFVLRAYRLDLVVRRRLTKIRLSTQLLRRLDRLWQNQYWDSDGQQTSGARTTAVVSRDFINPSLDEEVDRIDHTNDHGGDDENDDENDEETDDETDDRGDFEGEYDSDDDCDGSAYAGSGHCEIDSNAAAGTQSDDACIPAFHATNAQRCADEVLELLFGLSVALFEERPIDERVSCRRETSQPISLPSFTTSDSYFSSVPYRSEPILDSASKLGLGAISFSDSTVRKRFLVTGSASSFDEFFNLRNYGRVAAQSDTPPFLLHWSDDGQSVWWKDSSPLSMSQFRQLSGQLILEAESLCYELMQQGYSFVSDTANNLHQAYLELSRQACTAVHGSLSHKGRWKWKTVDKYLRTESRFRVIVGIVMQETGGQPARWSELLSLLCENSESAQRGLFKSHIIYITRHHKAKRSTNREYIVARFLPSGPSRVLYKYLAYIRPFVELLQRERKQSGLQSGLEGIRASPLLFRSQIGFGSKAWSAGRFNDALKRETWKVWDKSINSQIMRQLRIGITEKHVREVYQPFNRYDDKGPNASRNAIFAHQSGHRPRQRGTNYGLDGAFPTTLQPQPLELYEWVSLRWHEFLQLPSKQAQATTRDSTDCVASHDGMPEAPERHGLSGSTAAVSSSAAPEIAEQPGVDIGTIRSKRKLSLSWGQQPMRHKPHTGNDGPSDVSPRPKRTFREHGTQLSIAGKTDTADIHSSSSPSLQTFHAINGCGDPDSYVRASPTGEAVFTGPESIPVRPSTIRDPSKHLYIIPEQVSTALLNTQKELDSFNEFLEKYLNRRQSNSLMHYRLSRMIETTRWWRSIGCPLCFLCGETQTGHTLQGCKRDVLRNKTLSVIRWLEDLRIPQYTSTGGRSCSVCSSFYACGEATATAQDENFGTKESTRDPYSDGRCEIKPIIRMAIASLAVHDSVIFGNMLSKVPNTTDAEVWFERRIPYNGHWFSNILLAYEELMLAFYYRHNPRRGPLCGFPSHPPVIDPPASRVIASAYPRQDTEEEVISWKAAIGWWKGKCSFCEARGSGGRGIQHTLRQCTRGGSQTLHSELAEAMYDEDIVPNYGCDTCHLPYDFCDDWARMDDGEWVTITTAKGFLCQFGRHLLCDTIIGLYHCGESDLADVFRNVAHEHCVNRGLVLSDDEKTVAQALSQQIIVTNVAGSQLLRTLVVLTSMVLHGVKGDEANCE
ncbi:hypothetical protein VB005_02376 [Metarhizium brunneum]